MNRGKTVNLHIIDKDYVVACPTEEQDTLIAAAQHLNDKIKEVREGGSKVVSPERMVVISALNIIHEYLHYKQKKEQEIVTFSNEVDRLQQKIEFTLSEIQ
ncbi:MAG: cell division protein ZapA [Thiomargarita sp.]|nr:cell division protein ZapA [Thiomargarita sp.]